MPAMCRGDTEALNQRALLNGARYRLACTTSRVGDIRESRRSDLERSGQGAEFVCGS